MNCLTRPIKSSYWLVYDCYHGTTPLKRLIRTTNTWTMTLNKKKVYLTQRMDFLMTTLRKSQTLASECHQRGDQMSAMHHAQSIISIKREYDLLKNLYARIDIVLQNITDNFRYQALAVHLKEAADIMHDINNYIKNENVIDSFARLQIELTESNQTRQHLDHAIVNIQSSGEKANEKDDKTAEQEEIKLLEIIHEANRICGSSVPMITHSQPVIEVLPSPSEEEEKQLKIRLDRLSS